MAPAPSQARGLWDALARRAAEATTTTADSRRCSLLLLFPISLLPLPVFDRGRPFASDRRRTCRDRCRGGSGGRVAEAEGEAFEGSVVVVVVVESPIDSMPTTSSSRLLDARAALAALRRTPCAAAAVGGIGGSDPTDAGRTRSRRGLVALWEPLFVLSSVIDKLPTPSTWGSSSFFAPKNPKRSQQHHHRIAAPHRPRSASSSPRSSSRASTTTRPSRRQPARR